MLKRLRWRLTALYLLAAVMLVLAVGGGAFALLNYYFQSATDLALQYRMALEFVRAGALLPADLAAANTRWSISRERAHEEDSEHSGTPERIVTYDSELAAIFVTYLTADGQSLVELPNVPPIAPDVTAVSAAVAHGSDWRTVWQTNGHRIRLLTYRLTAADADHEVIIQMGRSLADQDNILRQLVLGLLALGGVAVVLMGAGSWWLAGRSLATAQQAWDRQQAFVANASHELRTPLTILRASAEVAQRALPKDETKIRPLLNDVLGETDHMSTLVEDLLLLSRLDAGRLQMEPHAVVLPELLVDMQRQMGRVAEARGVRLMVDEARGAAWSDPTRLRQVLLIVLDNALRHTPSGGVIQMAAHADAKHAYVTISDSGAGIPSEHLPRVFDRFYRADSAHSQDTGGAGLGLAIAKGLIEAQKGHIGLESAPGKGTRVTITLPASAH